MYQQPQGQQPQGQQPPGQQPYYQPQPPYYQPQQPQQQNRQLVGVVLIILSVFWFVMCAILGIFTLGLFWCAVPFGLIPLTIGLVFLIK